MQIVIIHDEAAYLANTRERIACFCRENKIDCTVQEYPGLREAVEGLEPGLWEGSERLVLEQKGRELLLESRGICYMEREKRKTFVICRNAEPVAVTEKLDSLLQRLGSSAFARCHNSFAVNFRYVREYKRSGFLLEDGTEIPVSRKYAKEVKRQFTLWLEKGRQTM